MPQRIGFEPVEEKPRTKRVYLSLDNGLTEQALMSISREGPSEGDKQALTAEGVKVVEAVLRSPGVREISEIQFDYLDVEVRKIYFEVEVEPDLIRAIAIALGWTPVEVGDFEGEEWKARDHSPYTFGETSPIGVSTPEKEPTAKTIQELGLFEAFTARGLSTRYYLALERAGFQTLDELLGNSRADLLAIRYITERAVDEIERKLEEMGLRLRDSGQREVTVPAPVDELIRREGAFGPLVTSAETTGEEAGDQPEVLEDPRD